jgi:hypothetical protein
MKHNGPKLVKVNEARHLVVTPKFRVSFPQLFVARSFQDAEDQKKEFRVDMIFDTQDDFKAKGKTKKGETPSMLQAFNNAKTDQWGLNKEKHPKMAYPVFKKGNERTNKDGEIYEGYEDKWFVTAKSGEKFPPKVILANGKPATEKDLYGGCFAQAALLARPYAYGKNFGVRFILLQVRKLEDGERFGGVSEDLFDVSEVEDEMDLEGDFGGEDDDADF